MTEVPDALTPFTVEELITAMRAAYRRVMGGDITAWCLAVLVGQACLESGNGKLCYGNCIGNVKPGAAWEGEFAFRACNERYTAAQAQRAVRIAPRRRDDPSKPSAVVTGRSVDSEGREIWVVDLFPPHPESAFRSFRTLIQACEDYLGVLISDRHVGSWTHAVHGEAAPFVLGLGKSGYFTANVAVYAKAVASIAARVRPACDNALTSLGHGLTDEDREHIASLVSLTLLEASRGEVPRSLLA